MTSHNSKIKIIIWLAYLSIVIYHAYASFKDPLYNWDILPYSAIVLQHEFNDAQLVHDRTYEYVQSAIPAEKYQLLIDSNSPYRDATFKDPYLFNSELKFYSVKPIYVAAVLFFYKIGFSLPSATILPGCISLILISVILLVWTSGLINKMVASIFCIFFLQLPFIMESARLSSPDMLNALFLFSGSYFLLVRKKNIPAFILFCAAVLTRPDSGLFIVLLMSFLFFQKRIQREYTWSLVIITISMVLLLVYHFSFPVDSLFSNFKPAERLQLNNRGNLFPMYIESYWRGLPDLNYTCLYFLIVGLITLSLIIKLILNEKFKDHFNFIIPFVLFHCISFYLIHPAPDDRFFITDYLLAFILVLNVIHRLIFNKNKVIPA